MNAEFEKFIQLAGGVDHAQAILQCRPVTIRSIRNGHREVSKPLAKQIIDAFPGELSLAKLLYPEKTNGEAA